MTAFYPGIVPFGILIVGRIWIRQLGIGFHIIGTSPLRSGDSYAAGFDACRRIAEAFAADVLSNSGVPSTTDVYGINIYFGRWGSYFAPALAAPTEIERIGRDISRNSQITVFTHGTLGGKCEMRSDEPYGR